MYRKIQQMTAIHNFNYIPISSKVFGNQWFFISIWIFLFFNQFNTPYKLFVFTLHFFADKCHRKAMRSVCTGIISLSTRRLCRLFLFWTDKRVLSVWLCLGDSGKIKHITFFPILNLQWIKLFEDQVCIKTVSLVQVKVSDPFEIVVRIYQA